MRASCIYLPEQPARVANAKAHFVERGLPDVEFFTGINAQVAGLATWHMYEVDNPGFRIGPHPTGVWLSHYMLWSALNCLPDEHSLIFETDAQLDVDFKAKWAQAMQDVPPDFDFLFLGHCCMQGRPMSHVAGAIYESKEPVCLHAYVLARKCIPFLLKSLRKCWAPIDMQLVREVFPHVKTYVVLPRIAAQFDTYIPE
jgi:GR25 family glycosyltransferase involved in LPS biosynthesis